MTDVKYTVDLRREEAKMEIDQQALELIDDVNACEKRTLERVEDAKRFFNFSREVNQIIEWLLSSQLVTWEDSLKRFHKDESILKEICDDVNKQYKKLLRVKIESRQILYGNELKKIQNKQARYQLAFNGHHDDPIL